MSAVFLLFGSYSQIGTDHLPLAFFFSFPDLNGLSVAWDLDKKKGFNRCTGNKYSRASVRGLQ
jgi:hypothetical protein